MMRPVVISYEKNQRTLNVNVSTENKGVFYYIEQGNYKIF